MSSRRFPRTKYVRALVRIEDELTQWIKVLEQQACYPRPVGEQDALDAKARELAVLRDQIHRLADEFHRMPFRMRDLMEHAPSMNF